jgi:hypothetical protein
LMAHGGPGNAQLGTDLAQGLTQGVQVGCTLNAHCATVARLNRISFIDKDKSCCELLTGRGSTDQIPSTHS